MYSFPSPSSFQPPHSCKARGQGDKPDVRATRSPLVKELASLHPSEPEGSCSPAEKKLLKAAQNGQGLLFFTQV